MILQLRDQCYPYCTQFIKGILRYFVFGLIFGVSSKHFVWCLHYSTSYMTQTNSFFRKRTILILSGGVSKPRRLAELTVRNREVLRFLLENWTIETWIKEQHTNHVNQYRIKKKRILKMTYVLMCLNTCLYRIK